MNMDKAPPESEDANSNLPILNARATGEVRAVQHSYPHWPQAEWNDQPTSMDFVEYWRILRLHRFLILRLTLLGLLAALVFSLLQKPVYQARTTLAIQDLNENFLNLKEDPTATSNSNAAPESYFLTQIKVLESQSLLEHVIDRLGGAAALEKRESDLGWRRWPKREPQPPGDHQKLIQKLASQLTVRASGQTRIVEIFFEAGDPRLASDFTNTLVDEFVEQSHRMRWESTQRTAEWLTDHLGEMKGNLETSEAQLQAYARTSGLMYTSEKGNVDEQKLQQLQEALIKIQAERAEKQAKFEMATSKPPESLPEILDDPTLREYGLKLTELQRELADLTSTLTPKHYRVQRVQAQIEELKSTLERQRTNIVRRTANEFQSARRNEVLLRQEYDQQANLVSEQTEKAIRYDTLKHEVDSSRQLYDSLLQKVKQAGLAAAMRGSNVLVVDPAKPPLLSYRPNYSLNSALGLFIGAFLGTGLSILRERLNRRIEAPGVAQQYLNLPELGAIPMMKTGSRLRRLFSARDKSKQTVLCLTGDWDRENKLWKACHIKKGEENSDLVMMAEAFRATLTSILLPTLGGLPPRVIVLTSPGPGAGKTTVTCNLGISMGGIGRHVLLIDGDLRRPKLHRIFQLSNNWGLCDVLRANNPIESGGLSQIIRHTDIPGLDLLASGDARGKPSYLLYSQRFAELLLRAGQEYDLVLIDAPPMMQLADARILGRLADGVILVIHAGQTTRESAAFSCRRFIEDGTRVLGTILNNWDLSHCAIYGTDYHPYGASSEHGEHAAS